MNVTELSQKINGQEFAPIYLITGAEDYLQVAAQQQFMKILSPEEKELNFSQYNLSETSLTTVLDDAMSIPFLGAHRLILLTNPTFLTSDKDKINHQYDDFIEYLKNPTLTTILAIFAPYAKLDERKKVVKELRKHAVIVNTAKLSEKASREAFQYELRRHGVKITSQALQLLIQRTDADFSLMMAQLPKLLLYARSSKEITNDAIINLITPKLEDNVFALVDSILKRDVKKALTQYKMLLLQQEDPIKLNAILLNQFRLLLQVKILKSKGYTQGNLATTLKVHPYRIKLALEQIHNLSRDDLMHAYLGSEKLEVQMKSEQIDRQQLFELFVLHFAKYKY